MAKLNSWMGSTKIKPFKMPKLLKEPKDEKLSITLKEPVQRKFKVPQVKFSKI